jgi:hypothetical protein
MTIGPGIFGAGNDFFPLFLRFDHQRRNDGVIRIAAFYFANLPQIHFERPVRNELDIVQAHQARIAVINAAKTTRYVHDWIAECFPHGATPTRVECAHDLDSGF